MMGRGSSHSRHSVGKSEGLLHKRNLNLIPVFTGMTLILFIFFAIPAHACTNPAGTGGEVMFNSASNVMQYCDGTDWIAMVGAEQYVPNAVDFDGVNDNLDINSLTGVTNTKSWTGYGWFKRDVADAGDRLFGGSSSSYRIRWASTNEFDVSAYNEGGSTEILRCRSDNPITDNNWHSFLFSIDLTDPAKQHLYIDGIEQGACSVFADDFMDITPTNHIVGSNSGGSANLFDGQLADLWVDFGTYIDLSVEANRRKFIDASGNPVNLGANGENPTGTSPDVFLSGDTANWHTNKGTGGGFTENGALTDALGPMDITQVVPNGLVGHWRLDETSGTTFADSSGNNLTASIANGLDIPSSSVTGKVGNGVNLAGGGSQESIDLGNPTELQITGAITVSGWFKPTSNEGPYLVSKMASTNRPYDLSANAGTEGMVVEFRVAATGSCGTGISSGTSSTELTIGEWAYVTGVYEPSSHIRVYINGELASENTSGVPASICTNTSSVYVGCREDGFCGNGFEGDVDDIRIYNRALTQAEIREIFEARDGLRYNESFRVPEFFDGDRHVAVRPPFPTPENSGSGYAPNAVAFDGTNDSLYSASLSGTTNSKLITGSFWYKPTDPNATNRILYSFDSGTGAIYAITHRGSNNDIRIELSNSAGVRILDMHTTDMITSSNWFHIVYSFDMANTSNRHVYINNVSAIDTVNTYTDDVSIFDTTLFRIGAGGGGSPGVDPVDGDIADFWFDPDTYIDLSVESNRRKFIDAMGKPVDLGNDGSGPTGSAPDIFLSGDTANWHTNKGTGGGFTENGALTDGTFANLYGGLVGHWKLDETSGTTAVDSAGNNDLSLLSAADFSNVGVVGSSLSLGVQGVAQSAATVSNISDLTQISFSKWFKVDIDNNIDQFLIDKNNDYSVFIDTINNNINFTFDRWTTIGEWATANGSFTLYDQWNHLVITYDASNVSNSPNIYLNGSLIANSVSVAPVAPLNASTPTALNLGNRNDQSRSLLGRLDDVRIYDRVLSIGEIQALYNMGAPVGASTALPQGCPNVGDVCDDGTVYAGLSPDGNVPMFTTNTTYYEFGTVHGNNGNTTGNVEAFVSNTSTGEANTLTLVTTDSDSVTAGFQPHQAAQICYDLVRNGADDWYLPAISEQRVFIPGNASLLQGRFADIITTPFGWSAYWSSTERASGAQWDMARLGSNEWLGKDAAATRGLICVRKGPAPRCANPYGLEGQIIYNADNNVMQYCDGARWIAIGKVN